MNDLEEDYTLVDEDLAGFWLQPAFVEGIVADKKTFAVLNDAYRHIFRRNLECGILLWNGVPVSFDYPNDLSAIVGELIRLCSCLQDRAELQKPLQFDSKSLKATWSVDVDEFDIVTVQGVWERVAGGHEAALNQLGIVRMPRIAFLNEWKLLFAQLRQSIEDAEVVLSGVAAEQFAMLNRIEGEIPGPGRFYGYLS